MENPATWGELERRIHKVRMEWERDLEAGVCGHSLERRIAESVEQWIEVLLQEERAHSDNLYQALMERQQYVVVDPLQNRREQRIFADHKALRERERSQRRTR